MLSDFSLEHEDRNVGSDNPAVGESQQSSIPDKNLGPSSKKRNRKTKEALATEKSKCIAMMREGGAILEICRRLGLTEKQWARLVLDAMARGDFKDYKPKYSAYDPKELPDSIVKLVGADADKGDLIKAEDENGKVVLSLLKIEN